MSETESVQDRLARLDSAATERVAWIIEQIADAGHTVSPPGMPWAGQDAIVKATIVQYELERPAAEEAVELARLDLWHGNSGASGHVERKLLVARLNVIRRIILQAVREPKKTITGVHMRKFLESLPEGGRTRCNETKATGEPHHVRADGRGVSVSKVFDVFLGGRIDGILRRGSGNDVPGDLDLLGLPDIHRPAAHRREEVIGSYLGMRYCAEAQEDDGCKRVHCGVGHDDHLPE